MNDLWRIKFVDTLPEAGQNWILYALKAQDDSYSFHAYKDGNWIEIVYKATTEDNAPA